jgi:hypothetical protein
LVISAGVLLRPTNIVCPISRSTVMRLKLLMTNLPRLHLILLFISG